MGLMAQWREQCRLNRRMEVHPPTAELTHTLHILPEPPHLLSLYPPPIPPSTLLPSWPNKSTPSLITPELLPFPQGSNIITTLCWLNEAGEGLTDEALLEWALDVLCSLEDWRWLWSLEPTTTPSSSLTPNQPPRLWYGVSNASLPSTSISNALSMYVPSVALLLLDTPNAPASCDLPHLWRARSCGHQLSNHNCGLLSLSPSPHG